MQLEFIHEDENYTSCSTFIWKSKRDIDSSLQLSLSNQRNDSQVNGFTYLTFDAGNQILGQIALTRCELIALKKLLNNEENI